MVSIAPYDKSCPGLLQRQPLVVCGTCRAVRFGDLGHGCGSACNVYLGVMLIATVAAYGGYNGDHVGM